MINPLKHLMALTLFSLLAMGSPLRRRSRLEPLLLERHIGKEVKNQVDPG